MRLPAQRVLLRYVIATAPTTIDRKRVDTLEDEIAAMEELQADLEGVVFMEEEATKLMAKAREYARKYPDLKELDRLVQSGLQDFHNSVIEDLSSALDELDEAMDRRTNEVYDLTGR